MRLHYLCFQLHFWDNKVLPTQVTAEEAKKESGKHWWYNPLYIITDLNVNSAIAHPAHDEILHLPTGAGTDDKPQYNLKGYAYAGGGKRVTRVEISLDQGETWELADV